MALALWLCASPRRAGRAASPRGGPTGVGARPFSLWKDFVHACIRILSTALIFCSLYSFNNIRWLVDRWSGNRLYIAALVF